MGAPVGLRQRYPSLPRRVCDRRRAEPHLGVKRSPEGPSIALRTPPDLFSFTVGDVTIQTTWGGGSLRCQPPPPPSPHPPSLYSASSSGFLSSAGAKHDGRIARSRLSPRTTEVVYIDWAVHCGGRKNKRGQYNISNT